jgi:hypothetical protein
MIFQTFTGLRYKEIKNPDYTSIKHTIEHWKSEICAGSDEVYNYVMKWIKNMLINPDKLNEVALIFRSEQGTGKTHLFTDIISEILGIYALPNENSVNNIIGTFNSMRENKKLIVLNEIGNSEIEQNHIKSVITEKTFTVNKKGEPQREADNVNNIIITTNCTNPVVSHNDDRRFAYFESSNKYAEPHTKNEEKKIKQKNINYEYFQPIYDELKNKDYYNTVLTYIINEFDIKDFRPQNFPLTQERANIAEYNADYYEEFIIKSIGEIIDGAFFSQLFTEFKEFTKQDENFKPSIKKLGQKLTQYCNKTAAKTREYKGFNREGLRRFEDDIEEYNKDVTEEI